MNTLILSEHSTKFIALSKRALPHIYYAYLLYSHRNKSYTQSSNKRLRSGYSIKSNEGGIDNNPLPFNEALNKVSVLIRLHLCMHNWPLLSCKVYGRNDLINRLCLLILNMNENNDNSSENILKHLSPESRVLLVIGYCLFLSIHGIESQDLISLHTNTSHLEYLYNIFKFIDQELDQDYEQYLCLFLCHDKKISTYSSQVKEVVNSLTRQKKVAISDELINNTFDRLKSLFNKIFKEEFRVLFNDETNLSRSIIHDLLYTLCCVQHTDYLSSSESSKELFHGGPLSQFGEDNLNEGILDLVLSDALLVMNDVYLSPFILEQLSTFKSTSLLSYILSHPIVEYNYYFNQSLHKTSTLFFSNNYIALVLLPIKRYIKHYSPNYDKPDEYVSFYTLNKQRQQTTTSLQDISWTLSDYSCIGSEYLLGHVNKKDESTQFSMAPQVTHVKYHSPQNITPFVNVVQDQFSGTGKVEHVYYYPSIPNLINGGTYLNRPQNFTHTLPRMKSYTEGIPQGNYESTTTS